MIMEINERWSLVEELDAFVVDSLNSVWFLPVNSKKSKRNEVLRRLPNKVSFREVHLEDNSFKIHLDKNDKGELQVIILNKNLSNRELIVSNINSSNLTNLVIQSELDNGYIKSDNIEAIFSDNYSGEVGFAHENMKDYNIYFDEMVRQVNCKLKKKTRKWIPGHRYDTETETLYYLGEFNTHLEDSYCSYYDSSNLNKVHLVCNNIRNFKNISDIFKTKSINNIDGIYSLDKLPLMVDSGEKLNNDIDGINFNSFIPYLFNNSKNLLEKLSIFNYFNSSEVYKGNELILLQDDIKSDLFKYLLNYWEISDYYILDSSNLILKSKTIEENSISLLKILFSKIGSSNSLAYNYYIDLFKDLNINLLKLANDVLDNFSENTILGSFDNYFKYYKEYFRYRNLNNLSSFQREKSLESNTYYSRSNKVYIKDLLGKSLLTDQIINLINYSVNNYGTGVDLFNLKNAGSKSNPKEYYEIKVTLDNIISFNSNLDQELKEEIIKNRFSEIYIEFDKNSIIQ